ncbi:hypothetical protein SAMN05443633_11655 [Chryseobacterium arachidis]|uniref:Uncharacterized protein n=1 Tax=Chryseobacterium arachidis TaxID=1416778 RepID=A0A1M5K8F2_9FLAO|nr:hypothetical protein SAMN05443633_11655 [Chryseobacterium arachidis]
MAVFFISNNDFYMETINYNLLYNINFLFDFLKHKS